MLKLGNLLDPTHVLLVCEPPLVPKEGEDARGKGGDGCEAARGEGGGKGN